MFCSNVLLCLYRRSEWVTNSRLCYFVCVSCIIRLSIFCADRSVTCTNQQPPQRGGAVPDPVWAGSKWLLAFLRVPVTPGTPLHFFAMLPPERPQEGSTASTKSLACFHFFLSSALLLPFFVSSFFFFSR